MLLGSSAKTVVSARNHGAGVLVAGRYRLERTIGSGGMGTVWLAHDQSLDAKCAVKLIDEDRAANAEVRLRFEREAKASAKLRSTHVVDVFDFGEWEGMCFMAMEYLQGEDLSSRLKRVGRLDSETTYRIVAHVARALMHAHAEGIVHRDLKPENIFLAQSFDEEIAKVLDFGIARSDSYVFDEQATREGAFLGTPCYVSPEQSRGKTVDYRTDLWSLGVITFECLTGHLPFNSDSLGDLMGLILYEPIPKPTSVNPDLPPSIDAWWERAAARDRDQRFGSAKEMADDLGEVLGVAAVVGVPSTGRTKRRGSYPSINDQSGVVLARAPTSDPSAPDQRTGPLSFVQSDSRVSPTLRMQFAVSTLALLISIGAIIGVWFRGKAAEASQADHPSLISRDKAHKDGPAQSAPQPAETISVERLPLVPGAPAAEPSRGPETAPANPAVVPDAQKRAPVRRRVAPANRTTSRDYGI